MLRTTTSPPLEHFPKASRRLPSPIASGIGKGIGRQEGVQESGRHQVKSWWLLSMPAPAATGNGSSRQSLGECSRGGEVVVRRIPAHICSCPNFPYDSLRRVEHSPGLFGSAGCSGGKVSTKTPELT